MDALLRLCLTDGTEDFSEARVQRVEWPDRDPVESSHRPRAHHLTVWPVGFFAPSITYGPGLVAPNF